MRAAVAIVCVLGSATASADTPYPEPLAPPSAVMPVQRPAAYLLDPDAGPKRPGTALMLSAIGAIAPPLIASAIYDDNNGHETELLWILGTSALLGPSLGHWYAGKVVTPGLGVRAVGFAVGAAAFGSDDLDTAVGLLMISASCILGGAIYDVTMAGRSARDYNFAYATRLMPVVAPTIGPGGTTGAQLGLAGTF